MSFPQTTPVRPVPGAFLNTPAVASRFQSASDPTRRQLFTQPETSNAHSSALVPGTKDTTSTSAGDRILSRRADAQGSGGLVAANPLPAPRPENIPPVVKAAKAINTFLQTDESFPDLDSCCRRE